MAVDAVHQRLYIADIVTGSVVVTDFDGRLTRILTGLPGPADLVLSPDARTLYVALSRGDAIAAVNTATYRTTARYATGADAPSQVVDLDPGTGLGLRPHGLAWFPDGSGLFALGGTASRSCCS
ncbi:YncE family protein [Streptomyces sp. NPDC096205]|uniref:YncE family protein n=1 Tax=Streptomyces sp. NPDC096205 TaxID=3366081 RepID=UPI00382515DD